MLAPRDRYVVEGTMKVFVYYQDRDKLRARDLLTCDVVLTTYPILENEYRKAANAQKV
jgi:DNA repair protein RAD16